MSNHEEITAAEARCAELYTMYQREDAAAARAARSDATSLAASLRRRAEAALRDYEDAVRNLRRARGATGADIYGPTR